MQSMLAAGLTTALAAAAIGAFASAQGIWGGEPAAQAEPGAAIELQDWTDVATTAAAQPAAPTPMVIYKDLEPIVVTRQVFTTAPAAPADPTAQPTTEAPTASATQPSPDATAVSPEPPVLVAAPEQPPTSFAAGTGTGFDDNGGDRSDDRDDDDEDWDDDWDDDDHDDDRDRDDDDDHEDDDDD